ncbi:MAG: UDP-N-acetylmuramoyl-tripeptide--D-alanyl-D-alanine ligase [Myxococcota bacterium]
MVGTPIPANLARFRLGALPALLRGEARFAEGDATAWAEGVFLDSRREGGLFVALRGERHDAHRFVAGLPAGVPAVVERAFLAGGGDPGRRPVVVVEDTLEALGDLAREHRRRFDVAVVAITGSAGKTTTRSHVEAALRGAGLRVRASAGNLNNRVGLPMSALTLTEGDDALVLEAGMNQPGEIARLAAIAEPTVALVTLVARAHTEGVGGIEGVFREKTSLLDGLRPGGVAIVNGDDARLAPWRGEGPVLRVGTGETADIKLGIPRLEGLSTVVEIRVGAAAHTLRLQQLGAGAAHAAGFALAVVHALGGDLRAAAAALAEVPPVPGRLVPRALGDRLVLDDAYNANPASMRLALRTGAELAAARGVPFFAVLGDMRELGDDEGPAHREVLAEAVARAAKLVTVGDAFAGAGSEVALADASEAAGWARDLSAEPAVFLVKGSRSLGLEGVVDALLEALDDAGDGP